MQTLWFPADEYKNRAKGAQKLMAREGIDLLFITGDRNYNYFSGHRPVTPEGTLARPNYFILPAEGDPYLMVHIFIEGDAASSSWVQTRGTYSSLIDPPIRELADVIRGFKTGGKRVGAELGQEQRIGMPVRDFLLLQKELELDDFEFTDAAPMLWEMRMVKSERELEFIRKAGTITSQAYMEGYPLVKEGMSEIEIARLFGGKMLEYGAENFWIMLTSGEGNYERISGRPTHRQVRRGDMVWTDMGAMINDYWADFSRAGVVGGPTEEQKNYQKIVTETTAEGVAAIKPGVPGARVVEACEEGMRKRNMDISFSAGRIGHGLGLLFTEPPSIAKWDPIVLQEGMVLSVEPGLVRDEGVYHAEANVIVTKEGCEIISKAPVELWSLG